MVSELNHALGLGLGGASDFQGFTEADRRPHASHETSEGEVACPLCHLRVTWPGIEDPCRGRRRARLGVSMEEVPAMFAMVWGDFSAWWADQDFGDDPVPTVDEWIHQLMEFRIAHRKAMEDDE